MEHDYLHKSEAESQSTGYYRIAKSFTAERTNWWSFTSRQEHNPYWKKTHIESVAGPIPGKQVNPYNVKSDGGISCDWCTVSVRSYFGVLIISFQFDYYCVP